MSTVSAHLLELNLLYTLGVDNATTVVCLVTFPKRHGKLKEVRSRGYYVMITRVLIVQIQ